MSKLLSRLLSGKPKVRTEKFEDDVLGALRLSAEEDWWEATVSTVNGIVGFKIGGDSAPSRVLIAHAQDIVRTFDDFVRIVGEFLAEEARRKRPYAEEIRQLRIEEVCLFWPERPEDGMIFFKGGNEFRVWRCDYIGGKPERLGFDD